MRIRGEAVDADALHEIVNPLPPAERAAVLGRRDRHVDDMIVPARRT
jgi:hypothetical protein